VQRELVTNGGVDRTRKRHGNAPGKPVGEAHLVHDALPVIRPLKPPQRAEAADREQLEVGGLPSAQVETGESFRTLD
jgi:hypothetical protein